MVLVAVKATVAVTAMPMMVVCAYHRIGHGVHSNSSSDNGSTDANDMRQQFVLVKEMTCMVLVTYYQCTMAVKAAKQHLCH